MNNLKTILWDLDGTIANTEIEGHRNAFNKAFNYLVDNCGEREVPFWMKPKKQDAFLERLRSN